jgi:hypothetical protein
VQQLLRSLVGASRHLVRLEYSQLARYLASGLAMSTKRPRTQRKRPAKVGERIVRAWFDTVINPLLQGLAWEQKRLSAKNWTWRYQTNDLESIRPCKQMLIAADNLEQFQGFYPAIAENVKSHDDHRAQLLVACQFLQKRLEESKELRALYEKTTASPVLDEIHASLNDLFGPTKPEEHISVLAEYIVNNTGVLPSYFTISPLWNRFREDFLAIAESASVNNQTRLTIRAGTKLLQVVNHLSDILKETREDLSLEYDMPYVMSTVPEQGM